MRVKYFLAVVAGVALTFNASALLITPGSASWYGADNTPLSASQLSDILNGNGFGVGSLTELYKKVVEGGVESGGFASSYSTTFSNVPNDPQDADVQYGGGNSMGTYGNLWLYIKDGDENPAYYLVNLSALGWNGTDSLELRTFWPNQGAIKYITILGNGHSVPDGGLTVMLLGAGLAALGAARRFIKF